MDEVIELTGAGRSFLVLIDKVGQLDFKVNRGVADGREAAGLGDPDTCGAVVSPIRSVEEPAVGRDPDL